MDIAFFTFSSSLLRVFVLADSTSVRSFSTSASYFFRRSLAVSHPLTGAETKAIIANTISVVTIL
nr:MAG TPA: hypothetical protein [Caudoviricetes sp.]